MKGGNYMSKKAIFIMFLLLVFSNISYAFEIKDQNIEISTINTESIKSIYLPFRGHISIEYNNKEKINYSTFAVNDEISSIFSNIPKDMNQEGNTFLDKWLSNTLENTKNKILYSKTIPEKNGFIVVSFNKNGYILGEASYIINQQCYTVYLTSWDDKNKVIEQMNKLINTIYPH